MKNQAPNIYDIAFESVADAPSTSQELTPTERAEPEDESAAPVSNHVELAPTEQSSSAEVSPERRKVVTSLAEITFLGIFDEPTSTTLDTKRVGKTAILVQPAAASNRHVQPTESRLATNGSTPRVKPRRDEYAFLASSAIDTVLLGNGSAFMNVSRLIGIAFNGVRAPKDRYVKFVRALNNDPRIDYFGGGYSSVTNLQPSSENGVYWPYDKPEVDIEPLQEIAEVIIAQHQGGNFGFRALFTVATQIKEDISPEEAHELLVILSNDSRVTPLEGRKFAVQAIVSTEASVGKDNWEDRYNHDEMHTMGLALNGRLSKVLGVKRVKHKKTYNTLTRAPRIIHPSRLLDV